MHPQKKETLWRTHKSKSDANASFVSENLKKRFGFFQKHFASAAKVSLFAQF